MSDGETNRSAVWTIGATAALVIIGGIALYWLLREQPEPEPVTSAAPAAIPEPPARRSTPPPPAVIDRPPAVPLPALDESDPDAVGGLIEIAGEAAVTQFLSPEGIIRKIVVTVDNAAREKMALEQRPILPTPGPFLTAGSEEARLIAPENYARYEPVVTVVRALDARRLVAFYRRLEPLFQQAYEELGYPDASFNDRLLQVIDHLLATPSPPAEVLLVQPNVLFLYADESLEKLSAGRKVLIRMGPENMAVIKAKLREIRAELQ